MVEIHVNLWNPLKATYQPSTARIEHETLKGVPGLSTVEPVKYKSLVMQPSGRFFLADLSKRNHRLGGPRPGSY